MASLERLKSESEGNGMRFSRGYGSQRNSLKSSKVFGAIVVLSRSMAFVDCTCWKSSPKDVQLRDLGWVVGVEKVVRSEESGGSTLA